MQYKDISAMQLLCHPQQTSMQHPTSVGTQDKLLVSLPFYQLQQEFIKLRVHVT